MQPLWWQSGVVYQIYPRSFRDSNGDGIGDLTGAIEKLDYLSQTLGVDAIWLSPFFPSPMADFGYDVSDYCDVDPIFGDLATFDRLVAEAHAREMRVIIDYVPNHTSDQHPWFIESRSSRDNPKRDWYVWRDPQPDGGLPNNWQASFGGPAWTLDETTGQYYLHSFLPQQPDLNWRNEDVKEAMFGVVRFWMERGVDGFRIDVAHRIMKDPELRDNPPTPDAGQVRHKDQGEYDAQLHINDMGHPDVHDVYRDMRALLDEYSDERPRVAIGEIHIFELEVWSRYYGGALDELHLPFNFGLLAVPWDATGVQQFVNSLENTIPEGAWPNYVVGNHDEPRVASRIGPQRARIAMMLLLTLRGTPTIYNGDELGMFDVPVALDAVQDPWGRKSGTMGRDPERAPMLWDASPNAGFTTPDAIPWLPIEDGYELLNVEAQLTDPTSMLTLTRRLLALRRAREALMLGDYEQIDGGPDDCLVYERVSGADSYLIALNFTGEPRTLTLPSHPAGTVVLSTHLDRDGEELLTTFELRGHEGCVIHIAPAP
jgi:alpha-glucosidase